MWERKWYVRGTGLEDKGVLGSGVGGKKGKR